MPAAHSPEHIQGATLALVKKLIACRSLTPDDAGSLAIVEARLTKCGFVCERIDRGGVSNLWARHGTSAPIVCFAGHVDVVPTGPEEQWSAPPFAAVERDGWLIGRGAADMKASVAAMVTAAERIAATTPGHAGSVAILLTADEEGDALHGTTAVVDSLKARRLALDYCIVGEPTSSAEFGDTLKNGRRGSLSGFLRVHGVQGHVAYPERGRNPIHQAAPALSELCSSQWDPGNADFGPTTFQISNIHAGTGAPNVVPGELSVQFNFRFSPVVSVADLQARVQALLTKHDLEFDLAWTVSALPFVTPAGALIDALREAVLATTGVTPQVSTSGGTSDGRFLAAVSREVVEFGPLNETIHKIDERVSVADLGPLSTIYERAARTLLGT
ncbi:MAG: succinyl-diaminopimelate desuccinylase [Vicinamibacterales bacterium]